jgi:type II secretory pathway component GspD/PulD (secretin)
MGAGRLPLAVLLLLPAAARAGADLPWPVYHLAADAALPDPLDAAVQSCHLAQEPIALAFLAVSRSSGLTFVLEPGIKGEVTLEVRQGTVRDLVEALTRSQGLYWEREGRLIAVRRNVTRCYEIDYPQLTRSAQGGSNVNLSAPAAGTTGSGAAAPGPAGPAANPAGTGQNDQTSLSILQQNQNTFWTDVQAELSGLAQAGENVVVNKFAGLAVVTAPPARQGDFQAFLATVNRRISRQVRIVARVVEVDLNSQHQLGVDWSLAGAKAGGISLSGIGTATAFSTLGGETLAAPTITGTLATSGISAVLSALRQQGEVHALSNPSVLSLSNQTAFVKVGTQQTFFSLLNSTTINQAGATAPFATTQNSYAQNAITIGTVLYVTPEVNGDGTVTVDVLPAITQLIGVDTSPDGLQTAPRMDIKALSTIARLHRDQSVMIGGLIYEATASQSRQVPGLADLPLVGRVFGTSARSRTRTELVIFLAAESVD